MPNFNQRLSVDLDEARAQRIRDAIKVLQDDLASQLINLTPDQRRGLPKIGDKTVSFVSKTLHYARANPHMCPPYVDVERFGQAWTMVEMMAAVQRPLSQVMDMLDDSLALTNSETYGTALACYQSIKGAAKLNVPGASTAAEDLGQRFSGRPRGSAAAQAEADVRGAEQDAGSRQPASAS